MAARHQLRQVSVNEGEQQRGDVIAVRIGVGEDDHPAVPQLGQVEVLAEAAPERRISAVVDIREDMGSEVYVHFGIGGKPVVGEDVRAAVGEDAAEVKRSIWVARVDRDTKAAEQHMIQLKVDGNRLHFFDPETGEAIYSA